MPAGIQCPTWSANFFEGEPMPRNERASDKALFARPLSLSVIIPAALPMPRTMPRTMSSPMLTNLLPMPFTALYALVKPPLTAFLIRLMVPVIADQAADIGSVIAVRTLFQPVEAVPWMDAQRAASHPVAAVQMFAMKRHVAWTGLITANWMAVHTAVATATMTDQTARRKARMPFQAAVAVPMIWVWKWFQIATNSAITGKKITK